MKKIMMIVALSAVTCLSGCAVVIQSHEAEKPVAPQPTVKNVSGKIQQGYYVSRIGKPVPGQMSVPASFSVMVPQAADASEYEYTQVSDQQGPSYTAVNFGPGWHDQSVYRLKVSIPPATMPFKLYASQVLQETVKRMKAVYQVTPIKLYQATHAIKGRPALFAVYQQTDKNSGKVFTQVVYVWQQQRYGIECWLTGTSTSQINPIDGVTRFQVVKNNFLPFKRFVNSIKVVV